MNNLTKDVEIMDIKTAKVQHVMEE